MAKAPHDKQRLPRATILPKPTAPERTIGFARNPVIEKNPTVTSAAPSGSEPKRGGFPRYGERPWITATRVNTKHSRGDTPSKPYAQGVTSPAAVNREKKS